MQVLQGWFVPSRELTRSLASNLILGWQLRILRYEMTMEFIDLNPDRDFTFSSCVRAGDFIYTSHHGGLFVDDGNIVGSIEAQTEQCFRNLAKTLEAAGASLKDIVKTTVLLRSLDDFRPMREVYRRYFTDRYPVRTAIFTDFLDEECRIHIDVVAYRPVKVKSSCL